MMKKRYVPILSFTVAMILVGSIAYAADRRKKTKLVNDELDNMSEEALKVELLSVSEAPHKRSTGTLTTSIDKQLDELSEVASDGVVSKVVTK